MVRLVVLSALAGCGRFGFDVSADATSSPADTPSDVVPLGHDEDGDGIADAEDLCPHLPSAQADLDGDGVGDECDPRPALAGDRIELFATMMPGDQPFSVRGPTDGTFSQLPDALGFDGVLGDNNNLYGSLELVKPLGSVRIAIGFDILEILQGSTSGQKQFALSVASPPPGYFAELNEIDGVFDAAQLVYWDGTDFSSIVQRDLSTGLHPGPVEFTLDYVVGTRVGFEVGWPGEPYAGEVLDSVYQGGSAVQIDINNQRLEIRYLVLITSP